MSATGLTVLTVLVGVLGALAYLWGERSAFPWMRFGAAAVLIVGIGVAVATWPDHHVTPSAAAQGPTSSAPGQAEPFPSLSPTPSGLGSSLVGSTSAAARAAGGLETGSSFEGSIAILTGGSGHSPGPHHTTPPPTPTPTTPSPSPSPSESPSPSPSDSPSPSPSDSPSPSPSESPSPSPSLGPGGGHDQWSGGLLRL